MEPPLHASPAGRGGRWLLALAASLSVFAALSPRDLWAPDEPRYGRIAYDMERGGDWLVSRWNGELDAEKPPLGYWVMAAAGRVAGEVTPQAARLPCALLALLAVLATAALGRRLFGDVRLGDTAALLFATSELVLWNSSRAGLDLPLTCCELLALLAAISVVRNRSLLAAVGMGAALGAGILFKGPHALYVPLGAVVGGTLLAGEARRLLDWRWLVALASMVAVVLAWLLPVLYLAEPAFGERLLGQLESRVRGRREPHVHGFPHLLGLVLACGLPWTPLWLAGLVAAWRRRKAEAAHGRFALGVLLGGTLLPLLLLSIAASKRDVYLIPLLPGLALLAAWVLHRMPEAWVSRRVGVYLAAGLGLLALLAFAAPLVLPRVLPDGPQEALDPALLARGRAPWVLVGAGLLALAGAVLSYRRRAAPVAASRAGGVALGLAWVWLAVLFLPLLDDATTWASGIPRVRKAAEGRRLVLVGAPDALLVWELRPDVIEMLPVGNDVVPETLDRLYAEGAPPVVALLDFKLWEAARRRVPSLESRATVLWARTVSHRSWAALVPASSGD
jgi:4-amino-4-deoxy-L-arabinose transferase